MKAEIHPKYEKSVVSCACGNTFETRSTMPEIRVEVCAACHPFYTGKQKLVDTAGRVDRFRERELKAAKLQSGRKASAKAEVAPATEEPAELIENKASTETAADA